MKIHCIGIGGVGVSALARFLSSEGNEVSGSDLAGSKLIEGRKFGGKRERGS